MRKIITVAILVLSLLVISCDKAKVKQNEKKETDTTLKAIKEKSGLYYRTGQYDALADYLRDYLAKSIKEKDNRIAMYCYTYLAQLYAFKENRDSVNYYLGKAYTLWDKKKEPRLGLIIYNIEGLYAIKSSMNYSKALECFQKGYELSIAPGEVHNVNSQIPFLVNISNIYYTRSDKQGIEYARKAYQLLKDKNVNNHMRSLTHSSMAMMLSLSGEHDAEYRHIKTADSIVMLENIETMRPTINLLYANYYSAKNEFDTAKGYYENALAYKKVLDSGTNCLIYLDYGRLYEKQNINDKAIEMYEEGIKLSTAYNNLEFRREFLHGLSHLYYIEGNQKKSLEYFMQYWEYLNNISPIKQEQKFNNLVRLYQKAKYDNEIKAKELDVIKAKQRNGIMYLIILLIFIIAVAIFLLYKKQRKMYRLLYMQYQTNVRHASENTPKETNEEPENTENNERIGELFVQIENLMRAEKFFKQKDISLSQIAERLNTNKTYVSQAINRIAGIPFNEYIGKYRIEEATRIISDTENDVPLKQLADELGFNSVSVFYKTFSKETGLTPGIFRKEAGKASKMYDK